MAAARQDSETDDTLLKDFSEQARLFFKRVDEIKDPLEKLKYLQVGYHFANKFKGNKDNSVSPQLANALAAFEKGVRSLELQMQEIVSALVPISSIKKTPRIKKLLSTAEKRIEGIRAEEIESHKRLIKQLNALVNLPTLKQEQKDIAKEKLEIAHLNLANLYKQQNDYELEYEQLTAAIDVLNTWQARVRRLFFFFNLPKDTSQYRKKTQEDLEALALLKPNHSILYFYRGMYFGILYTKTWNLDYKKWFLQNLEKASDLFAIELKQLSNLEIETSKTVFPKVAIMVFTIVCCEMEKLKSLAEATETIDLFCRLAQCKPELTVTKNASFDAVIFNYLSRADAGDHELNLLFSNSFLVLLKYFPPDPFLKSFLHYFRGISFKNQKKYLEALDEFTQAVAAKERDVSYLARGEVYAILENIPAATADFKQALELCPNNCHALAHLGKIAFDRKEYAEAEKYFHAAQKAIKLSKESDFADFFDEKLPQTQKILAIYLADLEREKASKNKTDKPNNKPEPATAPTLVVSPSKKEKKPPQEAKEVLQPKRLARILRNKQPEDLKKILSEMWFLDNLELIENENKWFIKIQVKKDVNFDAEKLKSLDGGRIQFNSQTNYFYIDLTEFEKTLAGFQVFLKKLSEILKILFAKLKEINPLLDLSTHSEVAKSWLRLNLEEQAKMLAVFTMAEFENLVCTEEDDTKFSLFRLLSFLTLKDLLSLKQIENVVKQDNGSLIIYGSLAWGLLLKFLNITDQFAPGDSDLRVVTSNPDKVAKFVSDEFKAEKRRETKDYLQFEVKLSGPLKCELTLRQKEEKTFDPILLARCSFKVENGFLVREEKDDPLLPGLQKKLLVIKIPNPRDDKFTRFFVRVLKYADKTKDFLTLDPETTEKILKDYSCIRKFVFDLFTAHLGKRGIFLEIFELLKAGYIQRQECTLMLKAYFSALLQQLFLGTRTPIKESDADQLSAECVTFFQHVWSQPYFQQDEKKSQASLYALIQFILSEVVRKKPHPESLARAFPSNEFSEIINDAARLPEEFLNALKNVHLGFSSGGNVNGFYSVLSSLQASEASAAIQAVPGLLRVSAVAPSQ